MTKVLVAEDSPINRELLRELLEARGYEVFEACNGQEALELSTQIEPDVLLLDIGMPVLDGFATVRKLRESNSPPRLPVLAVTAYAMRGDRENILNSGFDGYISKPIEANTLFKQIDQLLSKSR